MIINTLITTWCKSLSHEEVVSQFSARMALHYSLRYCLFTTETNRSFILYYNDIVTILSLYLVTIQLHFAFNFLYDVTRKSNFYSIKKRTRLSTKGLIYRW